MRKTVIVGALAFVLGGGAVFIYLNHSAQSTAYATMHARHHGTSGAASQGMMHGHMHDESTCRACRERTRPKPRSPICDGFFNNIWTSTAASPISPMGSQR